MTTLRLSFYFIPYSVDLDMDLLLGNWNPDEPLRYTATFSLSFRWELDLITIENWVHHAGSLVSS